MNFELRGKRVLLTGGTSDIGQAIVSGLLDEGCEIVSFDKDVSHFEAVHSLKIDFEAPGALDLISSLLETKFSGFDILINAAGVGVGHTFYDRDIFYSNVRVNLETPFLLSSILIQQNLALGKRLSIINITSLGASLGFPSNPSYQVTKAALAQLTRSISVDYSKFGIRANNLVPGYIKSGMTKHSWEDLELRSPRAERTSLNRWGQPAELVGAIKFLASDLSSYVTGTDLIVDGGWSSKGL